MRTIGEVKGPSRAVGGRLRAVGIGIRAVGGRIRAVGAIGGPSEAVGGRRGHRGAIGPKGSFVRPVLYENSRINKETKLSFIYK